MGPRDGEGFTETLAAQALEDLRFHWGDAYDVGMWTARRRDGLGGEIRADSPEELEAAILKDYSLRPVPREDLPGST